MSVCTITSYKQFKDLLDSDKVFIVAFWATWCGSCRTSRPVFEKFAQRKEYGEKLAFYKVDVDDLPNISEEVGITSLPTFIVFKHGKKIDELVGIIPARLETLIHEAAAIAM